MVHQSRISYYNDDHSFSMSFNKVTGHYNMQSDHYHEGYEVYYLKSGKRQYFINDRTYIIKKGMLVFINTLELHKTRDAGIPNYERYVINFTDTFVLTRSASANMDIGNFFKQLAVDHCFIIELTQNEQEIIEAIFSNMLNEMGHKKNGFEAMLHAALIQLVVTGGRYMDLAITDNFQYIHLKHKNILNIMQYMNTHYMEELSMTSISKMFFISPCYLSKIFKEATGFTFVDYINHLRIIESQKLLMHTNLKINQIYSRVGFGSISQFNRVFKKVTGQSPYNFRSKPLHTTTRPPTTN